MRKISSGILAGALMLIIGIAVGQAFHFLYPALKTEYENQNLFRPWSDPIMSFYYAEPFLVGIILAWLWEYTKPIAKGETSLEKGFYFGLVYWVITLPGMLMSYSSFPVSLLLVISWSVTIFIQAICSGILFSKLLK